MTDNGHSLSLASNDQRRRWVRLWLLALGLLVYAMVLVGGATRLTDSGLAMTEWRPVLGTLPPLTAAEWQRVFEEYRQTAEYRLQNSGMSLAEFKQIFYWEWGHRFFARVIGLVAIIGLIAFWWLKWIDGRLGRRMTLIIGLGAVQAVIGMWMVASGLGETTRVDVAPYRLMVHFSLALLILAAIFWTWLDLGQGEARAVSSGQKWLAISLLGLVSLQMAGGALVAGLDAGRTYTDWPKMAGEWFPGGYWMEALGVRNIFENVTTTQFNHRTLAYILIIVAVFAAWSLRRSPLARNSQLVLLLVIGQSAWGVLTLLHVAPLSLALVHQGLGVVVLLASVALCRKAVRGARLSVEAQSSAEGPLATASST